MGIQGLVQRFLLAKEKIKLDLTIGTISQLKPTQSSTEVLFKRSHRLGLC